MKDRIRLAEAMGIPDADQETVDIDSRTVCIWNERDSFNPFTDANDDYAVLEWMRKEGWPRWQLISEGCEYCFDYKVGDYARAALKVLDD